MQLKWMNADHTILQKKNKEFHYVVVEPGHPDWENLSARDDIDPYEPPTPEEILDAERARMVCTPAQMRLALHRMGLLAQVQGIADSDPEASIVWEYATQIVRTSPLIEALSGDFTPEEIDEIFRAAMGVQT